MNTRDDNTSKQSKKTKYPKPWVSMEAIIIKKISFKSFPLQNYKKSISNHATF